ncbi:MAG TPA: hypothetical protein VGB45_12040 [Abditibacterium sp.]|jgi:hypothetical protein
MALLELTDEWTLEIGDNLTQRIEDGSLVLSDETRAVWIDIFDDDRAIDEKVSFLKEDGAPVGAQSWEWEHEGVVKFGYFARDEENEDESYELTTFSVTSSSYVLMSFYFDAEKSLDWAMKRWRSLKFIPLD